MGLARIVSPLWQDFWQNVDVFLGIIANMIANKNFEFICATVMASFILIVFLALKFYLNLNTHQAKREIKDYIKYFSNHLSFKQAA